MVAKGHVNPLNCQLQKLSLNSGHTLLMMMMMKMMMMVIFDLENSNIMMMGVMSNRTGADV